jgi:hypothetical protein
MESENTYTQTKANQAKPNKGGVENGKKFNKFNHVNHHKTIRR